MKNVKRIIKALCIVVVVLLLVSVGNDLLFTRHSHCKIRLDGFYLEDKDSLEVVVSGASIVVIQLDMPLKSTALQAIHMQCHLIWLLFGRHS